jgi:hypothetical protein
MIVLYWAGYSSADLVPPTIKSAILLLVGHYWLHRESVVTGTISQELDQGLNMLLAAEAITGLY